MRVLVVDDFAPVRARLAALLGEMRAVDRIDEARDGQEGVLLAEATSPELVVLDLQLPLLGGLDVLRRLKQQRRPPVVVVLTNQSSAHHRNECMARGADYFFDKSLEFDRATQLLRRLADAPAGDVPVEAHSSGDSSK